MSNPISTIENLNAIPGWIVYSGAIAGLVVAIIEVVRFIFSVSKTSKLEIRLTKEAFFRLTNFWGESLFTNAILLAREGPVEVRNVEFKLQKTSGSQKNFVLTCVHFGEKVRSFNGPMAEFN